MQWVYLIGVDAGAAVTRTVVMTVLEQVTCYVLEVVWRAWYLTTAAGTRVGVAASRSGRNAMTETDVHHVQKRHT